MVDRSVQKKRKIRQAKPHARHEARAPLCRMQPQTPATQAKSRPPMLHLCMPLRYRIVRQPQAPCRRHGPLTANYPARHGAPQPHARQFLQGTAARYAAANADVDAVALIGAVVGHVAHVRVAPAGAVAVRVALAPVAACSVMPLSAYSAVLVMHQITPHAISYAFSTTTTCRIWHVWRPCQLSICLQLLYPFVAAPSNLGGLQSEVQHCDGTAVTSISGW